MKTIDPKTKERISKILPRLATATEIPSSVAFIHKLLKDGGYDWHDLVSEMLTPNDKVFSEADALEIYRRGEADGRAQARKEKPQPAAEQFTDVDTSPPWHEIAVDCRARPHYSSREKDFVEDMVKATVNGGKPTEKQQNWLRKIYRRRG